MPRKYGLVPIVDDHTRVLILGTLPGDESLCQQRYYCDSSNKLWSLVFDAFGAGLLLSYPDRLEFLLSRGVGLWDVLVSADRTGSNDSKIRNPQANDFAALLGKFPNVRRIGLNGTKAERYWKSLVLKPQHLPFSSLRWQLLPSSSGTPGVNVLSYDEKLVRWRRFLHG